MWGDKRNTMTMKLGSSLDEGAPRERDKDAKWQQMRPAKRPVITTHNFPGLCRPTSAAVNNKEPTEWGAPLTSAWCSPEKSKLTRHFRVNFLAFLRIAWPRGFRKRVAGVRGDVGRAIRETYRWPGRWYTRWGRP